MPINEVFSNPTVKQVVFQIRFPNLFYIESKIGDLQLRIMRQFPQSALLYRRSVLLADVGPGVKLAEAPGESAEQVGAKIWQFKSEQGVQLNVMSNSLDISSNHHKTYDLSPGDKFRDVIQFVMDSFLTLTGIPVVSRIGLRYIDECPIPSKDDQTFGSYYNSSFPLTRFSIADATQMDFACVVQRGPYQLRYVESLKQADNGHRLILDFDGFAGDIESGNYLSVTDDLHSLIQAEFEATIKEPVFEYMRQAK